MGSDHSARPGATAGEGWPRIQTPSMSPWRSIAWEGASLSGGGEGGLGWLSGRESDAQRDTARGFLRAQANTIEGGTSNVMRNILGERVLGLPKEPDTSRELAWKEVPRSA